MTKQRFTVSMILSFGAFFTIANNVFEVNACVGARPMGMGGAFIAVSDDVNSIYWNPAGFGRIEGGELTYARLLNNRDVFNYDDYGAVGGEWIGVGYIHSRVKDSMPVIYPGGEIEIWELTMTDGSLNLSVSRDFFHDNFYLGMTNKLFSRKLEIKTPDMTVSDDDLVWALDLGMIWEVTPEFSVGVLSQNLNEPDIRLRDFGIEWEMVHNLRPGVAWNPGETFRRVGDRELPDITVAVDMYDALDNTDGMVNNQLSVGGEVGLSDIIGFIPEQHELKGRVGGYLITERNLRAYTGGVGFEHESGFKLDYALMYFDEANKQNHLVAIGYRF